MGFLILLWLSIYLHNPPNDVHEQLNRYYDLQVKYYSYPSVTKETLIHFQEDFAKHVVGQNSVKKDVLASLYPLTRLGRTKPMVMMFYGPSGVGKTETAKLINEILGGKLLRKQFSMFQNGNFSSYLFGGSHSEASFAHDLLDRESGVILIDEFDKASPVFHSAFYEFFDEGIFEDKNYKVRLGPAVIICTSNYKNRDEIRNTLGDALYSRFDQFIGFEYLSKEEIEQVVDRLTEKYYAQLDAEEKKQLLLSDVKRKTSKIPARIHQANVRQIGKLIEGIISYMEAYSAAGKTWFGWWLVEHYFSYHVNCPDGCGLGEPTRGRKDPPYFQMGYGSFDHIADLVDSFVESFLPA